MPRSAFDLTAIALVMLATTLSAACAGRLNVEKIRKLDGYDYVAPSTQCAPGSTDERCALSGHYVLIHEDGYAITPKGEHGKLPSNKKGVLDGPYENQLDRIAAGIKWKAAHLGAGCDQRDTNGDGPTLKILLYVHGGLNGLDTSVDRMTAWMSPDDGVFQKSCYYPIFVNWNSAIGDSLWDDVVGLRFGQRPHRWYEYVYAGLTAPVVFTSRLVSAIGNIPIAMGHNVYNFFGGAVAAWQEEDINPADARGNRYRTVLDGSLLLSLLPVQVMTTPLLEGFGTSAWLIMKRRANLATAALLPSDDNEIFRGMAQEVARTRLADPRKNPPIRGGGAAWHLITRLRRVVSALQEDHWKHPDDPTKPAVTVTLVGHSMGAILLDRLVAISGDDLPVAHVVYLAPAASADDIAHTVVAYLHRQEIKRCADEWDAKHLEGAKEILTDLMNDTKDAAERQRVSSALIALQSMQKRRAANADTKLWIFTLNARDEAREISDQYWWFLWMFPRGSLLQWVDGYFEPNTMRGEAAAGKYLNQAAYEQPPGTHRVHCADDRLVFDQVAESESPPTGPPAADAARAAVMSVDRLAGDVTGETPVNDFEPLLGYGLYVGRHWSGSFRQRADCEAAGASAGGAAYECRAMQSSVPGVGDGRVFVYFAKRMADEPGVHFNNAPAEHGDFSEARFISQVLCRVDARAFVADYCKTTVPRLKPQPLMPPLATTVSPSGSTSISGSHSGAAAGSPRP